MHLIHRGGVGLLALLATGLAAPPSGAAPDSSTGSPTHPIHRQETRPDAGIAAPRRVAKDDAATDAVGYFQRAAELARAGRTDEAVFWFYVGQLRFRAFLAANPDLDPSGAPALFSSFMAVLGPPLNEHAFADIPGVIAMIDRVLAWDAAHPDPRLPAAAVESTRAGLVGLREQVRREADSIRAQRQARGLKNR